MRKNLTLMFLIFSLHLISQECEGARLYFYFKNGDYCTFENGDIRLKKGMLEIINIDKLKFVIGKEVTMIKASRDCRYVEVEFFSAYQANRPLFYIWKNDLRNINAFSLRDFRVLVPHFFLKTKWIIRAFHPRLECSKELIDFLFGECVKIREY